MNTCAETENLSLIALSRYGTECNHKYQSID